MKKQIILRADGNNHTGLGHLYRIFALIEMLKENFNCTLITREDTLTLIIPTEYNYDLIPINVSLEDEPEWLNNKYSSSDYTLVADGYQFSSTYQRTIKKLNYKFYYIDDLYRKDLYADVIINHSLAAKVSDYHLASDTEFALGTKYALLRPAFIEEAKQKRSIKKPKIFFVCFGGADPINLTNKVTKALLKINIAEKINVVIGAAHVDEEIRLMEKQNKRIKVYQNLSEKELADVMKESDFGIVPTSTILYELCCIKMPVLSGFYVDNQKGIYNGALEKGIIYDGGNLKDYTTDSFEKKINEIINRSDLNNCIESQSKLFDDKIKQRFTLLFSDITFRKANLHDLLTIFNWSNDAVTRQNSYQTEPIDIDTHTKWFTNKIKDENTIIFIAQVNDTPAGLVRFDIKEDTSLIGIMIANEYRGLGLASSFLKNAAQFYFTSNNKPISALIKKTNQSSIKSFEKANFKRIKEVVIKEVDSYEYILEK